MSATDDHVTRTVQSWIATPEAVDPEQLLGRVLAEVEATPQREPGWRLANILPFDPVPIVAVAAVAAGVVLLAFFAGTLVPRGGTAPGAHPSASTSPTGAPTPRVAQSGRIRGLPPEGSAPSSTEASQLIVQLESTKRLTSMWIYADGRVITTRSVVMPAMGDAYIGLIERHLTPEGADLLRTQIIDTGLFDVDLNLARDGNAPFLQIGVDNGGKFVRATWAWRGNYRVGSVAPVATAEQAQLLGDLEHLLSTPSSWPASAWADSDAVAYIPSHYAICFRGFPTAVPQWRVLDALPTALGTLLRDAPAVGDEWSSGQRGCALLSTDDAWTLARGLEQAGVRRDQPSVLSVFWLRYLLDDPASANNVVWISFEPVLPDGVATWLGPG